MGKGRLSALQDAVGVVFDPLTIKRGKRIRDGEPRSKTVHRSVHELHRDLPVELTAAREKVKRAAAHAEQTEALIAKRIAQGNEAITKQQEKLEALIANSERLEQLAAELSAREVRVAQIESELLGFEDWQAQERLKAMQKSSRRPGLG